jgi:TP901 family phage tail tape measure protein
MSQSIQIPVTQIGLEQSIVQGVRNASKKANFSLGGLGSGGAAQKINAISQPLGRITGQADEFSKSMAAANARVLAFGASAGIMAGVSAALAGVVKSAINVEQKLTSINTVLQTSAAQLEKFGDSIFDIAKNTGQSFDIVAEGALELARQGLSAADTLSRLNDALILSRLSGLDAAKSVEGLTAAYNSFQGAGETTATILNKLVVVSQKYAVSEKDLIEGVKRSASVADLAGVSFNELLGVITAVQQKTARGGAVIGNSFKTIFARIQDKGVLSDLQDLGVEVTDASKEILPATQILGNLSKQFGQLSKIQQTDLAKKLGGIYQLDKLLAGLEDLSSANSVARESAKLAGEAQQQAYEKNLLLNQTLAEVINRVTINAQELGAKLGALGVTDSLKNILSFFNNLLEGVQNLLGEESGLGKFVRGIVRGISEIVTGPGLALFAAIIVKLSKDLVVFGAQSLKSFFGIGKAAKDIKDLETSIKSALASNVNLQEQILKLGNDRYRQMQLITAEIQKQEIAQRTLQKISSDLSNPAYKIGIKAGEQGLRINPPKNTAAEGYIPAVSQEKQNIRKGVGGAKSGDKPVTLENFNFGGGKKGSIVAHTGEYVVPNFGGGSGSAIFNRDMVQKMGLPSGARKINAAGGFIPNFAEKYKKGGERTLEDARVYFGKQKVETAIAAFENPNTSENNLLAAAERLAKAKSMTYNFNASELKFDGAKGIGLVALQDNGIGDNGMGKLTSDSPDIQKILQEIGVPDLSKVLESKFRARNIDPKLFQGVKADVLQAKPNIAFENIKISSVNALKDQFSSDTFKDFQQTVNRLFARPISDLGNELFGSALGNIPSGDVSDKYIFGKDVLGSIFESATQFYIKGANGLPSFQEGEGNRNQRFDFPMTDAEEAKRLNSLFFKKGGVGIAEAKLTANSSTLNSIVSKGLNDNRVIKAMKTQIADESKISMAGGFIPNFANPLKEAIDREIAAGVPASQIYIDKNSSLKNAMNPMGLMVANRRDEPTGGIQGINRARKEGEDPMMYGAAYGLIPNFVKRKKRNYPTAKTTASPAQTQVTAPVVPPSVTQSTVAAGQAIGKTAAQTAAATISLADAFKEFQKEVDPLIKKINKDIKNQKISRAEGTKQIQDLAESKLGGRVSDKSIQKVVGEKSEKLIPDKAPQAMSDFVSKVFLAQSVLSGLTASFSELGEGAEKFNTALATLITSGISGFQFFEMFKTMGREQRAGRELTGNFLAAGTRKERQKALSAMDVAAQAGLPGAPGGTTRFLARRAAAVPTGAFSRGIGGASRVALSVISKVGPIFGRLIPIVGIAVTAFQAVSGIMKTFGIDLNKIVFDGFVKIGQKLGIVATDAEKLSKSFQKNSKEVAGALNTGAFQKGDSSFQKTIQESLTKASEEELKNRLRNSKQKSDKENLQKNFTDQLLNDQVFEINKEFFIQQSGLSAQQLEGQYKTRGFGGLQSITEENLGRSEGYGGREIIKGLSEVQGQAIASLDKDLIAQFSKSQTQKDFQKAVESKDVQQQELLIKQLQEESFAELKKLGKTDQIAALKKSIAKGGDLKDLEVLKKVNKERAALFGDLVKAAEVEKQLNLVDLQTAQQKLDNLIKYKTALLDIPSIRDNELSIEKELINTTDARKVSIERELTARKAAVDLTKQQSDAATAFLKDQGAIQAILQKAGINESTEESFREVASIVKGVSDQILMQGGYTDDVAKSTEELLQAKLKNKEAVERISQLLKDQMGALSDQQQIQLAIQDIELKRNSILEARNTLLKMENDQKLQAIDSAKEELSYQEKLEDISSRSFKTRASALKEVSPKSMQFDIDTLQNIRDRASARSKNNNQQQTIFRDLQKDLLSTALEKNFTDLAKTIKDAQNIESLENIGSDFAKAEKEAAIIKLNAAFDDQKMTINTAGIFKDIVVGAANELAKSVGSLSRYYNEQKYTTGKPIGDLSKFKIDTTNLNSVMGVGLQSANPTRDALNQLEKDRQKAIGAINDQKDVSPEMLKVAQAINSVRLASEELGISMEELDFTLNAASIQIEKQFAKLMLSFSNQIAQEQRKNIALAGTIERTGMERDFQIERRSNYSNIIDPQEYLKRQQSISLDYFNKIQALELEKANREASIQFKTEQMDLENIRQLIANTEALKALRDKLLQDPKIQEELKNPETVAALEKEFPNLVNALRQGGNILPTNGSQSEYSKIYQNIDVGPEKIKQMEDAAIAISKMTGDSVALAESAAKNIFPGVEDVTDQTKSILDYVNQLQNNKAESSEQGKTFKYGQNIETAEAQPSTLKEGVEQGFRDINKRREEFAFQFGVEIPTMFADGLSNALNSAIEGAASLKDALRSAAYEFVKGINQRLMSNLVDNAVGGLGNLGFGMFQAKASGGMITGGSGSKDDVPAMLMGGEYVVNKKAVSKYGPKFLEAINNGTLNGYAKGGKVQKGPQGNFYTPGTFGQGAISGKRNLLDFATQTGTSGKFDQMINESGYQAIDLESESSRLSVSGMRNSPQFEATQSAKQQAFDLYLQQYNAEREAKKQAKDQKKALIRQVGMLALSAALGPVINAAGAGFSAAFKGASGQGFMSQVGAGFKGIVSGGNIGGKQVGGLSNLFGSVGKAFSGDFAGASNQFKMSQIGNPNQLIDLYQSDKKFASYIDSMGGLSASGAPRATSIIPEAGRFSATRPNASVSSGAARIGSGIVQNGNVNNVSNVSNLGPPPADEFYLPRRMRPNKYQGGWTTRLSDYQNQPSLLPNKAIGGMIPSRSGIDTVPAMLSGGEFVMNRSAVQSIGAPNLQSMNSGGTSITSEETSKELNEKLLAKLDELIGASSSTGNITINVDSSGKSTENTSGGSSEGSQNLARQIRAAVLQVINEEKRIGGTLRR